jgi:hypothetical protein
MDKNSHDIKNSIEICHRILSEQFQWMLDQGKINFEEFFSAKKKLEKSIDILERSFVYTKRGELLNGKEITLTLLHDLGVWDYCSRNFIFIFDKMKKEDSPQSGRFVYNEVKACLKTSMKDNAREIRAFTK